MTHKAMKFRVQNPEHSKAIQERLFEMGYKWDGECKAKVERTEYPFLYAESNLEIFCGYIEDTFNKDEATETTLEEITEWTPKQGEMIDVQETIGGKWIKMEFAIKFQDLYLCHVPDKYQTFYGYSQARPINQILIEIEELKARLNELEAKL